MAAWCWAKPCIVERFHLFHTMLPEEITFIYFFLINLVNPVANNKVQSKKHRREVNLCTFPLFEVVILQHWVLQGQRS